MIMLEKTRKAFLIAAGTMCVVVGVIGIFVPLLPTTPFLLLAAYLYGRSSERYLRWLLSNRWFGQYLRGYREGLGIPRNVKLGTIVTLWFTLAVSGLFFVTSLSARLVLLVIGVAVSVHLFLIGTRAPRKQEHQPNPQTDGP